MTSFPPRDSPNAKNSKARGSLRALLSERLSSDRFRERRFDETSFKKRRTLGLTHHGLFILSSDSPKADRQPRDRYPARDRCRLCLCLSLIFTTIFLSLLSCVAGSFVRSSHIFGEAQQCFAHLRYEGSFAVGSARVYRSAGKQIADTGYADLAASLCFMCRRSYCNALRFEVIR